MTSPLVRPDAHYAEATRLGIQSITDGFPPSTKANQLAQLAGHTAICVVYPLLKAAEIAIGMPAGAQAAYDPENLRIKLLYLRPAVPLEAQPAYDGEVMHAVQTAVDHLVNLQTNLQWSAEAVIGGPLMWNLFSYFFAAQIQNPEVLDLVAQWLAPRFVISES